MSVRRVFRNVSRNSITPHAFRLVINDRKICQNILKIVYRYTLAYTGFRFVITNHNLGQIVLKGSSYKRLLNCWSITSCLSKAFCNGSEVKWVFRVFKLVIDCSKFTQRHLVNITQTAVVVNNVPPANADRSLARVPGSTCWTCWLPKIDVLVF